MGRERFLGECVLHPEGQAGVVLAEGIVCTEARDWLGPRRAQGSCVWAVPMGEVGGPSPRSRRGGGALGSPSSTWEGDSGCLREGRRGRGGQCEPQQDVGEKMSTRRRERVAPSRHLPPWPVQSPDGAGHTWGQARRAQACALRVEAGPTAPPPSLSVAFRFRSQGEQRSATHDNW